jgi:RNA polymerase sigma-70 factor (ECF subfamily)
MEALEERRLVDAAAEGDLGARAELYRLYRPEVYRVALCLVGAPDDADDVTQETMLRAFAALSRRPPRRLRPWLLTIARNQSLDLLRGRGRELTLDDGLAAPGSPHREAVLREQAGHLLGDLRALPERQRQTLVLRQLHELSYDEIGERLGVSPGAARQAVLQASGSLRQREAGRALPCAAVEAVLAGGDARRSRARDIQGHLDACARCRRAAAGARLRVALPAPLAWLLTRAASVPLGSVRGPGALLVALAVAAGGIGTTAWPDAPAASPQPGTALAPRSAPGFGSDAARASVAARRRPADGHPRARSPRAPDRASQRRPVTTAPAAPALVTAPGATPASPEHTAPAAAPVPPAARPTQGVNALGVGAETHQEAAPSAGVYADSPGSGHVEYPDPPDHVEGPHVGGEIGP